MRLFRVQFTVRRMMITIAVASLLLAIFIHRERRIRSLDRMVLDQEVTILSAEANFGNAVLAREAAEHFVGQHTEKSLGVSAEMLRNDAARTKVNAEQSRRLSNYDSELADAEKQFAQFIQRLDEGNHAAEPDAPIAAQKVIKPYIDAVENRVAASRANQTDAAQGPDEKTPIVEVGEMERARGRERIKKMILEYEKAYLKGLKRKRANLWW